MERNIVELKGVKHTVGCQIEANSRERNEIKVAKVKLYVLLHLANTLLPGSGKLDDRVACFELNKVKEIELSSADNHSLKFTLSTIPRRMPGSRRHEKALEFGAHVFTSLRVAERPATVISMETLSFASAIPQLVRCCCCR